MVAAKDPSDNTTGRQMWLASSTAWKHWNLRHLAMTLYSDELLRIFEAEALVAWAFQCALVLSVLNNIVIMALLLKHRAKELCTVIDCWGFLEAEAPVAWTVQCTHPCFFLFWITQSWLYCWTAGIEPAVLFVVPCWLLLDVFILPIHVFVKFWND